MPRIEQNNHFVYNIDKPLFCIDERLLRKSC